MLVLLGLPLLLQGCGGVKSPPEEPSMPKPPAEPSMTKPHVLMTGLAIGESPRWHKGRLWLSNWGAQEIVAVDLEGKSEVVTRVPTTIPFSIDWLPDGRLLVVSGPESKILRREPDGSFVLHTDLSRLAGGLNEIVVDGRGNIYVNGSIPAARGGERTKTGIIALITPDGSVRQVADEIAFPNGMVVTPDNKTLVIADSFGHLAAFDIAADGSLSNRRVRAEIHTDGICLDAEGAIWAPSGNTCQRISPSGQVLQRIELDQSCFACMLGGEDRKTLFMLTADWRMAESFTDNLVRLTTGPRTGQVLTAPAPAPRAGRP
jgi:sugar lactone lactonase YvrE